MAIIDTANEKVITSQDSIVTLDANSMVEGARPKVTPTSVLNNIDKLIEEMEKTVHPIAPVVPSQITLPNNDIQCELILSNKSKKKFTLYGVINEVEVFLPSRFSIHMYCPAQHVNRFSRYCVSTSFGTTKNKIILESCKTMTMVDGKRSNRVNLFTRDGQGFHKTYLQLDFFKIKRTTNNLDPVIEIEFTSV